MSLYELVADRAEIEACLAQAIESGKEKISEGGLYWIHKQRQASNALMPKKIFYQTCRHMTNDYFHGENSRIMSGKIREYFKPHKDIFGRAYFTKKK